MKILEEETELQKKIQRRICVRNIAFLPGSSDIPLEYLWIVLVFNFQKQNTVSCITAVLILDFTE